MVARLYTAADLWATGVALKRRALRREQPNASDAEVEKLLGQWLQERPGAELGDGPCRSDP